MIFFKSLNLDNSVLLCYNYMVRFTGEWRNWQTQRTQNPSVAISCGFKSHFPHCVVASFVSLATIFYYLFKIISRSLRCSSFPQKPCRSFAVLTFARLSAFGKIPRAVFILCDGGSDKVREIAILCRKLHIACDDFLCLRKKTSRAHSAAPPFRKRSRSARLLGCKRPRDASLSLTTFRGFFYTTAKHLPRGRCFFNGFCGRRKPHMRKSINFFRKTLEIRGGMCYNIKGF